MANLTTSLIKLLKNDFFITNVSYFFNHQRNMFAIDKNQYNRAIVIQFMSNTDWPIKYKVTTAD